MGLRVVIAGGGTGGHLFPGIAVARELLARRPGTEVSFAGTARGIEARVLPREGFALDLIRSGGIKGKSIGGSGARRGAAAGGRVGRVEDRGAAPSASGDRGGRLQFGPRRADGRVARHSDDGARTERGAGFDEPSARAVRAGGGGDVRIDARVISSGKAFVSGNPVRPEFFESAGPLTGAGADEQSSIASILVFGGSQGAHAINVAMVEAAPELAAGPRSPSHPPDGRTRCGNGARGLPARRGFRPKSSRFSSTWENGCGTPT